MSEEHTLYSRFIPELFQNFLEQNWIKPNLKDLSCLCPQKSEKIFQKEIVVKLKLKNISEENFRQKNASLFQSFLAKVQFLSFAMK